MKKYRKTYLAILLLLATALGACGAAKTDEAETAENAAKEADTITLTVFDKNSGTDTFTDAVAMEIMERTGVKIEVVDPSAEPEEKLRIMLSNKSYPDIVLMEQGEMVNRYIEAGALLPLDTLIENYGPDIQEMYGDTLNRSRYTDGQIYWLANWYGADPDASAGILMRRDLLAEIVGEERANSSEPFTQSEYTQILLEFKKKFPELEGVSSIALELDNDAENYVSSLRGMNGLKTYAAGEDGSLHYLYATEEWKEALLYLNELYEQELMDKNWIINKSDRWEELCSSGCVFSTWGSYWDTTEINTALRENVGEEAQFYCYKVVADGLTADQTTYNGRNGLGWDAIGITDNCQNPEAAIKVANFLASEEGQYLMLWGIEGANWSYQNGVRTPSQSFLREWKRNPEATERVTGVRRWTWFIKNGDGSDGTPYDVTTKYAPDETTEFANSCFGESDYWDTSEYSGLEPTGNTELGLKWQKIEDLYQQYYYKIVTASGQSEAENYYDKMVLEMEINGLAECEAYINEQYQLRLQSWAE